MTLTLKRHHILILGLILAVSLIQFSCSVLLADVVKPATTEKWAIKFPRAIQKLDGRGGFAYGGIRGQVQIEDYVLAGIEKTPPPSAWLEGQKKVYAGLLKKRKYDLLIVPFQTQWDGVDAIGRALMSYRLAVEIERRTNMRVAPMALVHQALGSTARVIDDDQVYSLARQMGCRHVVWGFAGTHEDSLGHMESLDVTIVEQASEDYGSANGIRSRSWPHMDISSNQLPSILFEKKLPEVLAFLGFPEAEEKTTVIGSHMGGIDIPPTPAALFQTQAGNPIQQSCLFQFMGALIPPRSEFHRHYMFIRSLNALAEANADHPAYAILKARAYYHLHRRPAALDALGDNQSPEAAFLLQLLNGNLPSLKEALDRIEAPLQKFLAAVEYLDLKDRYSAVLDKDIIKTIVAQYPQWGYFFELILNDPDAWDLRPNFPLKQCLDAYFPVRGFSLESLVTRQSRKMGQEEMAAISDQSFQEHIRRRLASEPLVNLSPTNRQGPGALDYLIMLEGIGQSNLVKQVRFYQNIQGSPEDALTSCDQFLKTYDGHPYFTLLHAGILKEQAYPLQGEPKAQLLSTAFKEALDGLWWYGGQGWAYRKAKSVLLPGSIAAQRDSDRFKLFKTLLYGIACDYPPRPDCARSGNMRPHEDLIGWSISEIDDLKTLVTIYSKMDQGKARDLIKTKLAGRFLGHPQRHVIEMAEKSMTDPGSDPKIPYIQLINQGTRVWKIYKGLGKLYVDEGEYAKARDVFMSYPGFAEGAPENRVALSNMAYIAGSYLFWQGAVTEARPLYEFSAGLGTGSDACLTSRARLALLDRDFPTAAQIMLSRAQRYDDSYGYRDYLTFSHLIGESEAAWQMFITLLGRYPEPHIWTSAFVGHRLHNTEKQELMQWIDDMARRNQTSRQRSFPARFGLLCLIDRPPDFDFADFVDAIDDLTKYKVYKYMVFGPDEHDVLGPEPFGLLEYINTNNVQDFLDAQKRYYTEEIPDKPYSFYGSFARAYEHLKNKEYPESYRILIERSRLYAYEGGVLGAALKPYLVWVGLKSGHRKEMDHYMYPTLLMAGLQKPQLDRQTFNGFPPGQHGGVRQLTFDDELSLAIYLAWTGDHESALERLNKAFHVIPHTDKRPLFPWYQMIEACEWLYEHSEDQRYLDLALKWVKDYQVIQPMFAWAFAFEAKYTQDQNDKIRALGYALYLDPKSWRISGFTDPDKQAASEWFQDHNPFRPNQKFSIFKRLKKYLMQIFSLD